jgi:hypothetical protein
MNKLKSINEDKIVASAGFKVVVQHKVLRLQNNFL